MSRNIKTPTNQKLLTNVAVVRMKKGGKRFEIACYRNKVLSWRQGTEKDLDEVLQSHTVFLNVSKGQVAKKEDLTKAFGSATETDICKEILAKGDLQVSDKERQAQQDALFKDVATHVAEMCVNPESRRPHPVSIIEKAMKECHIAVKPNKNAKQQALETIGKIKGQIPLERAQMRLRLSFNIDVAKKMLSSLKQIPSLVNEKEERNPDGVIVVCLVDPGQYRKIDELLQGKGHLELVDLKEVKDSEEELGDT